MLNSQPPSLNPQQTINVRDTHLKKQSVSPRHKSSLGWSLDLKFNEILLCASIEYNNMCVAFLNYEASIADTKYYHCSIML